ncbi:YjjG family noncanonical pyrimidine nucleotidase [Streptococcus mutans]|uniref:Noncanonical pyrimidine nucleotidase, YjjG family n=1 Tax=Streptococcus mutans SM6 TaxID=857119 RepID=A0A829BM02_STRMG|nr:YjjG family noncanonical pyrimidine nucleotidase [Streptococcus mutans]EMC06433.1 hypothetical protein SMU69_03511 [Streptococcus mutans NLML4]EMC21971.1 hypothetical protein SMU82_09067 [Streptococcus mutans SM6]MCB5113856.1 YjjG family noncanonical pyrimidine nucleotidase [Streptococcus mutans]MDT9541162.1 YjjG family noncanonical pyrimidine nucleotidase [Streptococcus mutans]MDT9560738.1 YjjG family noncanonical pyrimidine nucleotidase [Streptococcus mutans]
MNYKFLLFDLDHTLLDFEAAEDVALTQLLEEAQVPDVQTYKDFYIPMNQQLWQDLTLNKISKKELVNTRFAKLFAHFGQKVDGRTLANRYQNFLNQQGQTLTGAETLLEKLTDEGYRIFGATNGIANIQTGRMANSNIASYFEQVFISDRIGFQKPDKAFYDYIAEDIAYFDYSRALMIGDSLLADIQGGNNAGIDTVWYNPYIKTNETGIRPTYEVNDYKQLLALLVRKS